jgi:biotin-(acetyl-CoA carboxylase) ligase
MWRVSSLIEHSHNIKNMPSPSQRAELGLSVEAIAEQAARRDGAPSGTTYALSREVAGRTRGGEAWAAQRSASVALIIRPPWAPEEADLTWILAAIAGTRALSSIGISNSECQWPDVLMIKEQVVGRSYAKAFLGPGIIDFAVLSVRFDLDAVETQSDVGLMELEQSVVGELNRVVRLAEDCAISEIRREFVGLCSTFGQTLEIDLKPKGYVRGTVVDLAPTGGVVVESSTAMREIVSVDALRRLKLLST